MFKQINIYIYVYMCIMYAYVNKQQNSLANEKWTDLKVMKGVFKTSSPQGHPGSFDKCDNNLC
jgi:hypothetical protein